MDHGAIFVTLPARPARLVFELQAGQRLLIGEAIVTLIQKSGRAARLLVEAPRNMPVSNPLACSKQACDSGDD